MSIAIKKVTLWRTEVENKPGALSSVLTPLADAGADPQVVMGYGCPGDKQKATIEVCPVAGKKSTTATSKAGLAESKIATLLVQGDNRPGMAHAIAQAIGEAGLNVTLFLAQVIDGRFSATIGLASEAAAKQATALIKKAAKKIEKQFGSSDPDDVSIESPVGRSRILVLCRKKCDAALQSFCSDSAE